MSDPNNSNKNKESITDKNYKEINKIEDKFSLDKNNEPEIENIAALIDEDNQQVKVDEAKITDNLDEYIGKISDDNQKKIIRKLILILKENLKKIKSNAFNFLNNDLAPSLGNQGLSSSSLSQEEKKKKWLGSLLNLFTNTKTIQDLKVTKIENTNPDFTPPAPPKIDQVELTKKINADLINDLDNPETTKGPLSAIADSRVKGNNSQGRGR
jgi:hypothetical protein